MRQIILDTETTGIDPRQGHRIIEIAGIEMIDRRITRNTFHQYINPEREIDVGAMQVHGISNESLVDKPLFSQISDEFIDFVKDANLIIHNAPFDVGFLDSEFRINKKSGVRVEKICSVTDTLAIARKLHPGQRNNLDALCKRYGVDNSKRDLHGALIDCHLLAQVYLAMTGGQGSLFADEHSQKTSVTKNAGIQRIDSNREALPIIRANDEALQAHQEYMNMISTESRG